jgi:uncharacterized protein (TIGR02646 family)
MIHVCLACDPPDGFPEALEDLVEYQRELDAKSDYAARVTAATKSWENKTGSASMRRIRAALVSMCSGQRRCMFCEDSRGNEIEHFQPKSLYPEYVFAWANFLYSCGECNGPGRKGSKFKVVRPDKTIVDVTRKRNADVIPPEKGEPLLINPRFENPFDLLHLDLDSGVFSELNRDEKTIQHQRAKYTIETLGLNDREELPGSRKAVFIAIKDILEKITRLKREDAPSSAIQERIDSMFKLGHRAVWEQMKRFGTKRQDLKELFNANPEAIHW